MKTLDQIALVLTIIGGINWGLIGFFDWDLVASIFGDGSGLSRTVYALVGLAALWTLFSVVPKLTRYDSDKVRV